MRKYDARKGAKIELLKKRKWCKGKKRTEYSDGSTEITLLK